MGYCLFMAMPLAAIENHSLLSTARILEQRGLAKNGIRGLGDLVGEYAARLSGENSSVGSKGCPNRSRIVLR